MRKIMNLFKTILPLLIALMALSMSVSAGNYINTENTGSITIELTRDAKIVKVSDGSVALYHVADIVTDEIGEYYYQYTSDFNSCSASLSDIFASDLPQSLSDYITANNIAPYATMSPENGILSFQNLPLGVYFVKQETTSEGFYGFLPFVITVPSMQNGAYVYDVEASPKMELVDIIDETEEIIEEIIEEDVIEEIIETPESDVPSSSTGIVQTGDYTALGLLLMLCTLAVALFFAGKKIRNSREN